MNNINCVTLQGNLTRDAELKTTSTGKHLLNFSIANNIWAGKDHVNFFNCDLWGNQANSVSKYMTRGKQIIITGQLKQERYEIDGQKKSIMKIIVRDLCFAASQKQDSGQNNFEDDLVF